MRRLALCLVLGLSIASAHADDLLRSAQVKLAKMGYFNAKADGVPSSVTSAAIRRFQVAEKLKVTGELNQQTIDRLGLTAPAPVPVYTAIGGFFQGGPLERSGSDKQVAAVRSAQKTLAGLGYFGGSHNGLPGPALAAALKDWQRDSGLAQTGKFDKATVVGLRLNP